MTDWQHPPKVVADPEVLGGIPCLAGSRLPATTLLAMVQAGTPWESITASWPWLTPAHVEAARAWAATQPVVYAEIAPPRLLDIAKLRKRLR